MKRISIVILLLICNLNSYAQNEKTLDETKSYIIRMINEFGGKDHSSKNQYQAEFDGDFLKIFRSGKVLGLPVEIVSLFDFSNVYRFKGPIREPGDVAHIIIWVDYSPNRNSKWKKNDFEITISNYEAGEQLMIAFKHLNKLLIEKKPAIEKF